MKPSTVSRLERVLETLCFALASIAVIAALLSAAGCGPRPTYRGSLPSPQPPTVEVDAGGVIHIPSTEFICPTVEIARNAPCGCYRFRGPGEWVYVSCTRVGGEEPAALAMPRPPSRRPSSPPSSEFFE